jgi:serine/threonine protein kinase
VASIVESPRPARVPEPTPIHKTDAFRLSRPASAGEVSLPEIQPSDIEEIPGYELLGILGRGGMGIVFRARQVSLKRQVALKMILAGRHARPQDRLRFQKEAEAVARLAHPNIVQIYEVGQQNGLPYFSLEFVNAGSLAQFLGGVPQSPTVAAQLVMQLAGAMHYAHHRGIVHRDLKPANILLHLDESRILRDGHSADTAIFRALNSYVPKISDFGLAMHMGGEDHSRHGTILGTPSYMAPEQAGRSNEVGPAADVYALGAILYEMLTGRPPFRGPTVQETTQQLLAQNPVPPAQLQPKIPHDLETICLTCLRKDPGTRYASAEALGEDLRRFLNNEPILAHPTPLPDRLLKWSRRRPTTALAMLAAVLVAAVLVHTWGELTYALRCERDQARAECEQTAAQFEQALSTIDQLAAGAGSEPRRPSLLKAAAFYEALALESRGQPGRRAIAAHAYQRLGELRRQLGDPDGAVGAYQEAIAHLEPLCQERFDRPLLMERLQECRIQLQGLRQLSSASARD